MMLFLAPELVDLASAPNERPASFPPYDVYPPDRTWVPPSGALSSPHRATAAFGEHLVDRFVTQVASALEREFR